MFFTSLKQPLALITSTLLLTGANFATAATVFINEIHYDNQGSDLNEGIEIAGVTGTSLDNWQLFFYNGGNGSIYKNETLTGTVIEQSNGFGSLFFNISGLQNGPADAIALVDNSNSVIEFLSYEGTVLATEGIAAGITSFDIGIDEPTNSPIGFSLQRIGTGSQAHEFNWISQSETFGAINTGQSFSTSEVPLPAGIFLYLSGIIMTAYTKIKKQ